MSTYTQEGRESKENSDSSSRSEINSGSRLEAIPQLLFAASSSGSGTLSCSAAPCGRCDVFGGSSCVIVVVAVKVVFVSLPFMLPVLLAILLLLACPDTVASN